jgi:hypothetical protein
MVRQFIRCSFGLAVAALALALVGCGGVSTTNVSGVVKLNGKPLNSGTIAFTGPTNYVASANIDQDGSYEIGNAPIGDVTVTITSSAPVGDEPEEGADPIKKRPSKSPEGISIPKRYSKPATSGLGFKVTANMTKDFELTRTAEEEAQEKAAQDRAAKEKALKEKALEKMKDKGKGKDRMPKAK